MRKKCFYSSKGFVQKYGNIKGIQRYKCVICSKQFLGGERINNAEIWREYVKEKQIYWQLSVNMVVQSRQFKGELTSIMLALKSKNQEK